MNSENRLNEMKYSVDGFRSLNGFSIELTPGINALVGPNGSGKTNFLEFLEFLDSVLRAGASDAVSIAGGISRTFCIEQQRKNHYVIKANIRGVAYVDETFAETSKSYFDYVYSIEIKFSKRDSTIFIPKEEISIFALRDLHEIPRIESPLGSISIRRRSSSEFDQPEGKVSPKLLTGSRRNPLSLRQRYEPVRKRSESFLRDFSGISLRPDESLLSFNIRRLVPILTTIRSSLTRGRSFNIDPSQAREPDNVGVAANIKRDGSGLSSTIYQLQLAAKGQRVRTAARMNRLPESGLDTLTEWTRLVLPEINSISVTQDLHSGKYTGYIKLGDDEAINIPFSALSDGTIKWLSVSALIITMGGYYSFEEPENFLHPKMQEVLMQIMKDYYGGDSGVEYFLLSTHSETIVNNCAPGDLIIFEFVNGKTFCRRINDPSRVLEEINDSGFGLGYYYASNAL